MDTAMLIGSRFEAGTGTEDMVLNPRTGELIVGVPEAAAEQVDRAVRAAEAAFKGWSRTTPAQRSGYLLKIAAAIEAEAPAFAALEALNCGTPINAVLHAIFIYGPRELTTPTQRIDMATQLWPRRR